MQALLRWLAPILNPEACLPPAPQPAMAGEKADALLKRLDLLLRQKVRFSFTGERRSRLKGQGLDFSGLREYSPGDDIRKMDWSVFARTLSPYVREYHEEKQLTLWLVVDLTPSMHFGQLQTKAQQAVELAALMGLMAQKANHKMGALIIQGAESRVISPKAGPAQVQHLLQLLLEALEGPDSSKNQVLERNTGTHPQPDKGGKGHSLYDPLSEACRKLGHLVQKQHTVMFLSDFLAPTQAWQAPLGELSRRAQLLCLMLADSVESMLPAGLGLMTLLDPESGELVQVDTNDSGLRARYTQLVQGQQEQRLKSLREMGVATLVSTDSDPIPALLSLLAGKKAGRC